MERPGVATNDWELHTEPYDKHLCDLRSKGFASRIDGVRDLVHKYLDKMEKRDEVVFFGEEGRADELGDFQLVIQNVFNDERNDDIIRSGQFEVQINSKLVEEIKSVTKKDVPITSVCCVILAFNVRYQVHQVFDAFNESINNLTKVRIKQY